MLMLSSVDAAMALDTGDGAGASLATALDLAMVATAWVTEDSAMVSDVASAMEVAAGLRQSRRPRLVLRLKLELKLSGMAEATAAALEALAAGAGEASRTEATVLATALD